ncbi:MAG: polysaccharide biosynthesis/export family protein [Myxococcales bacterium]
MTNWTKLVAAAGVLAISGCSTLVPGLKVDEGAAEERGRASDPNYKVEPITPQLLVRLAGERTQNRPPPDPNGNAIPGAYTVAPYDVLQVTVWDHPELTAPTGQFRSPEENGNPVNADGTVFYPYVGVVTVAGKTLPEIRSLLTSKLAGVIQKPQLDVRIAAFRGKRAQVTGEVVLPTPIAITDVPLHVQDAIAFARGFTPDADQSSVTLTRQGKTYLLDLLALYEHGDMTQNWLLQDGDVINVGDRYQNRVFILGEVRLPQARPMLKRRMTLAEAIGDAAGFDLLAANTERIYVIRGDYSKPNIFRLDASSADAMLLATEFQLKPKDIVFVSSNELTRFNRVMVQILPTVQILYDAAVAADIALRPR